MTNVPARRAGVDGGRTPAVPKRVVFSRAALRRWLEEHGPQPFGALLAQARLQIPDMTEDALRPHLEGHPSLFTPEAGDRWSATVERPRVVRPTRFTPPPAPKRATRVRPTRRARPEPPAEAEVFEQDGRVAGVVFTAGGAVHEGGGRIRLALPSGQLDPEDLARLLEMFVALGGLQVTVHERLGDGTVFRGTRGVIEATIRDGRVEIVLSPASDDDGRAMHGVAGGIRALPAGNAGDTLLPDLVRNVLDGVIVMPPAADAERLRRRAPTAVPTPDVVRSLGDEIRRAAQDPGRWATVVDRLTRELSTLDEESQDRTLAQAIRVSGAPFDRLLGVAIAVHEQRAPGPVVARAVVLRAGDDLTLGLDVALAALDYVGSAFDDEALVTAELLLAAARIELTAASQTDGYGLAARRFMVALDADASLSDSDLLGLVQAGALAPDAAAFDEASDLVGERFDAAGPAGASDALLEAMEWLSTSAGDFNAEAFGLAVQLIACRVARQEIDAALATLRTGVLPDQPTLSDLLDVMALFEGLESRNGLEAAATELLTQIHRYGPDAAVPLLDDAIRQLQVLESLIGIGPVWSTKALALRPPAAAPLDQSAEDATPLAGVRITIVGFDPPLRRQLVTRLQTLGGRVVAEVAPSWEAQLDEQRMRAAVTGADLVLECTSQVGHDAVYLLNNLAGADLGYERIRVWGGPSAAVRTATEWAQRRGSAGGSGPA